MSIFSDIGNVFSSAASLVQDAAKLAMDVAPLAFPQLAIAQAVGGLLTQAVGQAVNGAAQQLCKEAGMPKFLQDVIGQVVKDVLSQLQQQGGDKGCHDAAQQHFGGSIQDIIKD